MEYTIQKDPQYGRLLWLTGNGAKLAVALDFGIRILHAGCVGMENLLYQQPADLSDGYFDQNGWRLYGGHRLWAAPENELSTTADNFPIHWSKEDHSILLWEDPSLQTGLQKFLKIIFLPDGHIRLEHSLLNISDHPICCASWGITSLAPGGYAKVDYSRPQNACLQPQRSISLWGDSSVSDPRLTFTPDQLKVTFQPLPNTCKIGLYCPKGLAVYENKRQRFTLRFSPETMEQLPDGGCNFELFLCRHFMELEALGIKKHLEPGEYTSHWELWKFEKMDDAL